jgi:O-antigen ligase
MTKKFVLMINFMIFLIFLFSIFYFVLAWRKLDWAVMLIILALPAYLIRFQIFGVPMTILEAMILIAFFVWFIKETNFLNFVRGKYKIKDYLENRKTRSPYPFGWELSLWVLIAWIAAVVAGFSNEALGIWKAYFFEPALFFILVLNVLRDKEEPTPPFLSQSEEESNKEDLTPSLSLLRRGGGILEKILWALAGSAFLVSVFAIYQKLTGNFIDNQLWQAETTRRVVSFFGYPNAVGLFLGPIVLILIGWIFTWWHGIAAAAAARPRNDKVKIIFIFLTLLLSLLAIYFAKSEGALFGIIVALFIFGILAGKKLRWIAIIGALVIFVGVLSYPPARIKVVEKITLRDLSGEIRKQQWRETWQMMTESPVRFIFGTGLSGYQKAIAPYHKEGIFFNSDREPWEQFHRKTVFNEEYRRTHWQPVEIYMYPHNILLNFWTEMGLLGVLLFIWIVGKYLWIIISNFEFRIFPAVERDPALNKDYKWRDKQFSPAAGQTIFKYLNLGLMGAMIVIIVHGLVDVPYFKNDLAVMFWLLIALISLVYLKRKNACK